MLRPVGSRAPVPHSGTHLGLPWAENYHTWYMGSGTQALSAAVRLAISWSSLEGAVPEVILPAYGCPDLVAAVVAQGARPVLVDLLPDCPFMDTEKLSQALSDATVAVIGAGFLGMPEQLPMLADLCRERGVWLIEDSAQCFPPDCAREPIADCAVLSFGRGKPINLMGGGALLVRDDHNPAAANVLCGLPEEQLKIDWKWKVRRRLFNFLLGRFGYGLLRRIPFLGLGTTVYKPLTSLYRVRLPAGLLEAGILEARVRPAIASKYGQKLEFLRQLGWSLFMDSKVSGANGEGQVILRYGFLAPNRKTRDRAIKALNRNGIGANAFYGQALPDIEGVSGLLHGSARNFPNAASFAERLITLPSHEDVTDQDVSVIVTMLSAATARD
ncbi:DegT/DnrJ/EryC1/StrS family aminotransferase [Marinobacter sp.]|uniref:DegT/DnrJ/EryC1/StrS family aminotransferase n=1 Tax=Marinobacter sp. TaxID=50741 RepID=UPI003A8F8386